MRQAEPFEPVPFSNLVRSLVFEKSYVKLLAFDECLGTFIMLVFKLSEKRRDDSHQAPTPSAGPSPVSNSGEDSVRQFGL